MPNRFNLMLIVMTVVSLISSFSTFAAGDFQAVVKGNSAFGFDLYQKLKDQEGNLFFSPYSISTALAMTYAGARGRTEKEMAAVLHFPPGQELLHSSFAKLESELKAIQDKGHLKLSVANSLWAQEGYGFLDSFFELNKKYYRAGLNFIDFRKAETARKTINAWVEEKTEEKIRELIKPGRINPSTKLVLCNAIYFHGDWLTQFEKKRTVAADFYLAPKKTVKVPMMHKKAKVKFEDFGDFSGIELPYAGKDLSMFIFLPKEINGLAGLEKNFTAENVEKWLNALSSTEEREVLIGLPKFKTACEFELRETLSAMGVPSAFSPRAADFSGMTGKKDLYISEVIHKAFIDLNEEGTEAAAATAVILRCSGVMFRANHPFIFFIREKQTGSILFIGRIVNPAK